MLRTALIVALLLGASACAGPGKTPDGNSELEEFLGRPTIDTPLKKTTVELKPLVPMDLPEFLPQSEGPTLQTAVPTSWISGFIAIAAAAGITIGWIAGALAGGSRFAAGSALFFGIASALGSGFLVSWLERWMG